MPGILTLKQQLFVDYYLGESNGNATEAARLAGYAGRENTLATVGKENLKKPDVWAEVTRRMAESAMTSDEVLSRTSAIARGSLGDFLDITEDGDWKLNLPRAKKAAKLGLLKKLKCTKFGVEIELHDPLTALNLLGKRHRLWNDGGNTEVDVKILNVILDALPEELRNDVIQQIEAAFSIEVSESTSEVTQA